MTRWTLSHIDVTLATVTSMTVKDDSDQVTTMPAIKLLYIFAFATLSFKMLIVLK